MPEFYGGEDLQRIARSLLRVVGGTGPKKPEVAGDYGQLILWMLIPFLRVAAAGAETIHG